MGKEILSPLTQAMQEGAITRQDLKRLMVRSDKPAAVRLCVWLLVLLATSTFIGYSMGTWLLLPAMMLHGFVLVHHFSLQHECCHYTAFKTRRLNDVVGNICGLIIMLPNRFFRYEHCDHHTYTQLLGHDPELIELPTTFSAYFEYLSSIPYWKSKVKELWRHTKGELTPEDKRFVPREESLTIITEARLMVLFYTSVIVLSVLFQSWNAVWYWFLPVVLGEPFMRAIRMTEHVGRPTIADMKSNTRSNRISAPFRFLCWNMNYHAEHHYASSVPFHALPALNKILSNYIYTEPKGYIGAHKDIISQLLGKTPRYGFPLKSNNGKAGSAGDNK